MTPQNAPQTREPRKTLLAHALELHARHPDEPFPHGGQPFPDAAEHQSGRLSAPSGRRRPGRPVAAILARYFAGAGPDPAVLADAFHHVHVPIHPDADIGAVVSGADRVQALETGRWLLSPPRSPAT